jgi:hypothetical protein
VLCADCFERIETRGFRVVVRRIEERTEFNEPIMVPIEATVCADCAGWYDDPIPVDIEPIEALR